jgi:hypothetical protein
VDGDETVSGSTQDRSGETVRRGSTPISEPNLPAQALGAPGWQDAGTPITAEGPLAEGEPEGIIPPSPLWPMKMRRHFQWSHLLPHGERAERVREKVGDGDDAVYVIDDGHHHRVIGRDVGATADGCHYSLIARITTAEHEALSAGRVTAADAMSAATGLSLFGVVVAGPESNVFLVGSYADVGAVPPEFLPPHGPIDFAEDLDEF